MHDFPGTPIGQLSASGSGEVRDVDGNLLDNRGNVVASHERDED